MGIDVMPVVRMISILAAIPPDGTQVPESDHELAQKETHSA